MKLYFTIETFATPGQSTLIQLDGYTSYQPEYFSRVLDYAPETASSSIEVTSCCMGIRGNIDADPANEISISDLIYLVGYMFSGGPESNCPRAANLNGGLTLDISDLTYLVDYMFSGGYPPLPCW